MSELTRDQKKRVLELERQITKIKQEPTANDWEAVDLRWQILNTRILKSIALFNAEDSWAVDWDNSSQDRYLRIYTWVYHPLGADVVNNINRRIANDNEYCSFNTKNKIDRNYTENELKLWAERGQIKSTKDEITGRTTYHIRDNKENKHNERIEHTKNERKIPNTAN